jgi:hypothetical protein
VEAAIGRSPVRFALHFASLPPLTRPSRLFFSSVPFGFSSEVRECVALLEQKSKIQDELENLLCSLDQDLRRESLGYLRTLDCDLRVNDEALAGLPAEYRDIQTLARQKHKVDDELLASGYFGVPSVAAFSEGVSAAQTSAADPDDAGEGVSVLSAQGTRNVLTAVTRRLSGEDGPLLAPTDGIEVNWWWWGLTVDITHGRYEQLLAAENSSSVLGAAFSSLASGPHAAAAALLAAGVKVHASILRRYATTFFFWAVQPD